jgi:hypothetical protein
MSLFLAFLHFLFLLLRNIEGKGMTVLYISVLFLTSSSTFMCCTAVLRTFPLCYCCRIRPRTRLRWEYNIARFNKH